MWVKNAGILRGLPSRSRRPPGGISVKQLIKPILCYFFRKK
ncbi:hypothetical protein GCWU000246_01187 [Jonquetella anthropi E3_33 E1]|nr:hypothetical protein GCWU000246_01187 [Jonquetella anthropi E3_33 E1]